MSKPTFIAVPRTRKLQVTRFDAKDRDGKKNLVAWLKGHPQITNVKHGGTWIRIELENQHGDVIAFKLTSKFPILVWDDIEGLLHYSEEQFAELYRTAK